MPVAVVFWDASALAKRYTEESGRDTVDALFANATASQMVATPWTYAETYSILLRRYNGGVLDRRTFTGAVTLLQAEVVHDPDFRLLTIADATVFASLALMRAHNINAVDAALLAAYLGASQISSAATPGLLVTADQRFERAARAERLPTLNPQTLAAADVPAFLAALPHSGLV